TMYDNVTISVHWLGRLHGCSMHPLYYNHAACVLLYGPLVLLRAFSSLLAFLRCEDSCSAILCTSSSSGFANIIPQTVHFGTVDNAFLSNLRFPATQDHDCWCSLTFFYRRLTT